MNIDTAREGNRVPGACRSAADQSRQVTAGIQAARDAASPTDAERNFVFAARHSRL